MSVEDKIVEEVLASLRVKYNEKAEFNNAFDPEAEYSRIKIHNPDGREIASFPPSQVLYWGDPDSYEEEYIEWVNQQKKAEHENCKQWLKDTEQEVLIGNLANALAKQKIAPFVGAGLSKPCGMPLWGETIEKIAEEIPEVDSQEIENLLEQGDYLEAAQKIFDDHEIEAKSKISRIFGLRNSSSNLGDLEANRIDGPIKLLTELTHGPLITTNFDELIEEVFKNKRKPFQAHMYGESVDKFPEKLIKGEPCLLKLHGHVGTAKTYILTKKQYEKAYGNLERKLKTPLSKTLRQIYISHTLLFLGCSMYKDKTLELFSKVFSSDDYEIPQHFALLPEPEDANEKSQKSKALSEMKIAPIWYNPEHNHIMLENLLKLIIDMANEKGKVRL